MLAADEPVEFAVAEEARLAQHLIDQCRLAVIDMSDNGHIAEIGSRFSNTRRHHALLPGEIKISIIKPVTPGRQSKVREGSMKPGTCEVRQVPYSGEVMEFYLIRHAEAAALGESGISDDAHRPLTSAGVQQCEALAHALRRHDVRFDQVLTSPLLRAHQTAEVLLQHWPPPAPPLHVCDYLAPGHKRRKLTRFIRDLGGECVALVGHMPDLAVYASWLIGGKKAQLDLAKAGIACIHFDGKTGKGHGLLVSLVPPEWYCGGERKKAEHETGAPSASR
jgi:phosphohistidine phosphatase